LNDAEFRPTALVSTSGATISLTKDWRAGASNAAALPNPNAATKTIHG